VLLFWAALCLNPLLTLFSGKVFKKLDFNVPANIVNGIIMCKPGVIEIVLHNLRVKVIIAVPIICMIRISVRVVFAE
jgi:hypothetical protein